MLLSGIYAKAFINAHFIAKESGTFWWKVYAVADTAAVMSTFKSGSTNYWSFLVLSLKIKYYPSKILIRIALHWLSFSSMNWQFERLTSKDISKTAEKLIAVQAHRSNEY